MKDEKGYFVNDTGKTIQDLLDESKAKTERGKFNLKTRMWDTFLDENGKFITKRAVGFNGIDGWLTDNDLIEIDPDEEIFQFDSNRTVRLCNTLAYKEAKRRIKANPKAEQERLLRLKNAEEQKQREEAELEKGRDAMHSFLS